MHIHPDQDPRWVTVDAPDPDRSLGDLARAAAAQGGQRPFVTFYDDGTGERTELGHATLDNWVSKTANLLADEFDLGPGKALRLRLGTHWIALVAVLAAWRCGALVRWDGADADADAEVVAEELLVEVEDPQRTLVVGSGLAGRLTTDASGALSFTDEVLGSADEFDDPEVPPTTGALELAGARDERTVLTHGDLLASGAATVEALGLGGGERLLLLYPLDTLEGVVTALAALEAGASIVVVARPGQASLASRAVAERCDLVLAPGGGGQSGEVPSASLNVKRQDDGSVTGVRVTPAATG